MSVKLAQQADYTKSYKYWNATTALCYHNKLCCANCSNKQVCDSYVYAVNEYGIKPIKYAVIKTYQTIGKANYRQYL